MKAFIVSLAVASASVLALEDLTAAASVRCTTTKDCPTVACHKLMTCTSGRCEYIQVPAETLCPGQGCSNGGGCDDDANDYCDVKGKCNDTFKTSACTCKIGTGCYDDAKCDGKTGKCPANAPSPTTKVCTGKSNGGPCDAPTDNCDGKGNCKDNYLPSTKVCKAGGPCTDDAKCDGKTGKCPANAPSPTTKVCTGKSNNGECDGPDHCDGAGNCKDVFLGPTVLCGKGATLCDASSFCDGSSSTCPVVPNALIYLDEAKVSLTTYLSDTVTQCSAKAVSVGSGRLTAMYSTAANNVALAVAAIASVAVLASIFFAKKAERDSIEDGYAWLADDIN
ncbi:hypothetical protein ACHHYP_08366 [Achlya hypogyna]|uniref:Secreted protein n=1 Tax=Achlya hypogyna TaxID=1202772 RepID=A0A1V9ZKU2_ACHHY|nr:hypothetical protein ACHHYP_08366 [Achlya hypogyna]